jgi:3-dehydrosphinganine reductase
MNVNDKVIVITGGSSGLGLGLAKHYAKHKAKLVLLARNIEKLESAQKEILAQSPNTEVIIYSVDISNQQAIKETLVKIVEKFGGIDVLINSAGILVEGYFENTPLESFENVMQTNFLSLVSMTHEALPYLKKSKGRIINIASMASFFGTFGYTSYCASKFAVLGFSEALRVELKPQGIHMHVVCPPEFEGPMVDGIEDGRTPENIKLVKTAGTLSVDQVVKETVEGIDKKQFIIIIGSNSRVVAFAKRLMPNVVNRFLDMTVKKIYVGPNT